MVHNKSTVYPSIPYGARYVLAMGPRFITLPSNVLNSSPPRTALLEKLKSNFNSFIRSIAIDLHFRDLDASKRESGVPKEPPKPYFHVRKPNPEWQPPTSVWATPLLRDLTDSLHRCFQTSLQRLNIAKLNVPLQYLRDFNTPLTDRYPT